MIDDTGTITAHFISHWGVPAAISPRQVAGAEVAILEFAPRGERRTWRYSINGMSRCCQYSPDPSLNVCTELYVCTNAQMPLAEELLIALAAFPNDNPTYIADGDTIDFEQPIRCGRCSFVGILLAPPGPIDSPTLGLVAGLPNDVLVHQVVGLLPSEMNFAKRHGGKRLWERLAVGGEPLLDGPRAPVI